MEAADGPVYTPTTCGLEESHVIYLNQNRLTCADVLATTVTVEKLLMPQTSLQELGARQQSMKKLKLPPPAAPMTLPMPRKRMNKILTDERDTFLKQLTADREARAAREHWASTRIQAIFRGYRHRPRPLNGYERKRRTNVMVAIRRDLQDMQRILVHTPSATLSDAGSNLPAWRRDVHSHAMSKREAKHRRDRLASAATMIQACVKRFLARVGYGHLVSRRMDELVLVSAIVIQAAFRGYLVRKQMALQLVALQSISIVRIQAVVRGILTRERVALLRMERNIALYQQQLQQQHSGTPSLPQHTAIGSDDASRRLRQAHALVHVHRISNERLSIRRKSLELHDNGFEAHIVHSKTPLWTGLRSTEKTTASTTLVASRTRSRRSHSVVLHNLKDIPVPLLEEAPEVTVVVAPLAIERLVNASVTLDMLHQAATKVQATARGYLVRHKPIRDVCGDGPLYRDVTSYEMYAEELVKPKPTKTPMRKPQDVASGSQRLTDARPRVHPRPT